MSGVLSLHDAEIPTFIRNPGDCIFTWKIENLRWPKMILVAFPAIFVMNSVAFLDTIEVMAILGALILLGFMVFSPPIRARWHLFRCNYSAAAEIYEKLLTRRPDRLKLYSTLAEIYLLLPRNDAQALQVFKKVLQFNLDTPNREEIDAIVVQSYLKDGSADAEAVTILENALRAEYHKNNLVIRQKVLSHKVGHPGTRRRIGARSDPKTPGWRRQESGPKHYQ